MDSKEQDRKEVESNNKKKSYNKVDLLLSLVTILLGILYYINQSGARLPFELIEYYRENPTDDIIIRIPVYIFSDEFIFPDLVEATQIQVDWELKSKQYEQIANYKVDLKYGDYFKIISNDTIFSDFEAHAYFVKITLSNITAIFNAPDRKHTELFFKEDSLFNNDLPFFVTQTILYHVFHTELDLISLDNFQKTIFGDETKPVIRHNITDNGLSINYYKPTLNLNFTIFAEENQIDDNLIDIFHYYFNKLFFADEDNIHDMFQNYIEFTHEIHIEKFSYNDNDFSNEENFIKSTYNDDYEVYVLNENDSSIPPFLNKGKIHNDTLNFVLYIPNFSTTTPNEEDDSIFFSIDSKSPLVIDTDRNIDLAFYQNDDLFDFKTNGNAYLIPRQGALIVMNMALLNELNEELVYRNFFKNFKLTLLVLLGFPKDPKNIILRVEIETRIQIILNLLKIVENLWKITQLPEQKITQDLMNTVDEILMMRAEVIQALSTGYNWTSALSLSNRALETSYNILNVTTS